MPEPMRSLIEELKMLRTNLSSHDFLLSWEQSEADLRAVLLTAEIFEQFYRAGIDARVFRGGLAVSIFRDKSTRTRFSFASAATLLGLSLMDFDETKTQVAHGETVRETANMISFLTEAIGVRDDMFIGEGHEYMVEVSEAVKQGFEEGVLPQKPSIINLQCDRDHPTQSMADLMHLRKTFGSLKALRGKKIAMSWAYSPSYGKPLSVPQGIVGLLTRFGMNVSLAHPEGYGLMPEIAPIARRQASESGGSFEIVHSIEEAFADADIVYPKSWAPYEVMQQRTEYLRAGQSQKLETLEGECLEMNAKHKDWECTEDMMAKTRDGKALYMHCLPADITGVSCEEGEVAASVFDRYRTATYYEAEHKPYVMAAMILLNRFEHPDRVLYKLLNRELPRRRG
ncbi:MAG: knotted carbamoyltransferase YgeW [bacterium]|nr:knotted carbamoyltransferase YgeW [bacterium]